MRGYQFLSVAALLILSGCVTRVEFITPQLELPERPVLPTVSQEEVACLSAETYENWLRREMRLKGHINVLRAIIEMNNTMEN